MTLAASSKKKIQHLVETYDKIYIALKVLDHPTIDRLADLWVQARKKYVDVLENRVMGVKSSALIVGLEQGLRELPLIIDGLPALVAKEAQIVYQKIMAIEWPNLLENDAVVIKRIVESGDIKSESEYRLVKLFIDRIENKGSGDMLKKLYILVDKYEKK